MRNRYLTLLVLLIAGLFVSAQAQTYDQLWKEVEQYQQKDLPRSVISETMEIYAKAKAEQNVPQMMKSYLTAMQYRTMLAPDSLEADYKTLERWAAQTERVEEKAMLYTILGQLMISKDVKQAFVYLQRALENKESLLNYPADRMKPMVEVGDASRQYFKDNLYHILAVSTIQSMQYNRWRGMSAGNQTEALPKGITTIDAFLDYTIIPASDCDFVAFTLQLYQSLLKAYHTKAYREARLLTGIDALRYLNQLADENFSTTTCINQLQDWMKQYADVDVCAETYIAMDGYLARDSKQVERLEVVRKGIANYPRYAGINRLKNREKAIVNPSLSLTIAEMYPGVMQEVTVNYKNLKGVTLQLYKVDLPITSPLLNNRPKDFLSRYARLQQEAHFDLKPTPDYKETKAQLKIQMPMAGLYFLNAIPDGHAKIVQGTLLHITALQVVHRALPDGKEEFVVIDSESGHPVPQAEIRTYKVQGGGFVPLQTYTGDDKGTFNLDFLKGNSLYYQAVTPDDKWMPIEKIWKSRYSANDKAQQEDRITLFTDRSVYRPGQVVYVSGLAYEQRGDSTYAAVDKAYTVTLHDVNQNEIGKVAVKTNAFGSFSGQFALPSPCLTGYFHLKAGHANYSFSVEEYKRPTFDVTFEPVKREYGIGDSILLVGTAKTFAGAPVQGGKVHYKVMREQAWFRRFAEGATARWEGEATTDAEGKFTVPVRFEVDANRKVASPWFYHYKVEASVTNGAGETQEGSELLPLGSRSILLAVEGLSQHLVKEKASKLTFSAVNLSFQSVKTEVTYEVFEWKNADSQESEIGKSVLKGTVWSNQPFLPEAICALPSGSYQLKLSAKDTQGRECTARQDFILFSLHDKRPPVSDTPDWFYQDGREFNAAAPATIYLGSSEQRVYLLYDVFAGNKRLESKRIEFSDSILSFKFPYKEEYGNGILVTFAFVKNGRIYSHNVSIVKPEPDKRLQLKWETFRDKLRPGQKEEWKLNVLYPDGRPAQAELLATLYDASLEQFSRHALPFALRFSRGVQPIYWRGYGMRTAYLHLDFPLALLKDAPLDYSRLIVPSMDGRSRSSRVYGAKNGIQMMASVGKMQADSFGQVVEARAEASVVSEPAITGYAAEEGVEEAVAAKETTPLSVRRSFAETAFFYPQLRTDDKGQVSLSFTMPESLTRWKFLGLAHTQAMDYAHIDTTAVTSKEFMLQPNLPRFVRVGDRVGIAASLINLSEKEVKGTVRMELFNPETDRVFLTRRHHFVVGANATGKVNFTFDVSEDYPVIACRMVADGGTFSDGEQNYIPVLTDKQWVTESVSLDVNGAETKTFSLESLFNQHSKRVSGQRMTVEFTSNPAWMAVQALPAMANPQTDDAYAWATAYYANALARVIIQSHPRIQQVFETWTAQGGTKETFMSELQKNEELKNIILAETPWRAEAATEAEQRRTMATLFDLNTMSSRLAVAATKLRGMQTDEGAWSWYPGMSGSITITTQITELLARLRVLSGTAFDDELTAMYRRAKTYLSSRATEEYKEMKAAEARGTTEYLPSEQTLQYLYICALDGNVQADEKVNHYFIDRLASNTNELTIYGKALGAIILQQAGKQKAADEFMQSLLEYSIETPDRGRYFDTSKAKQTGLSYKIPTEVAAIEAVQRLTKDEAIVEQMKRWLLKEKQTQQWHTPIATVNAVYALLNVGNDWLTTTGVVKITVGDELIQTSANDPIGYVKKRIEGDVLQHKQVTVVKEGAGMGWGAVYAQYLTDMHDVKAQGNALSISRVLLQNGKPMAEEATLAVGDRVTVRLTVKAERDMDFVQLKEDRAACMEPVNMLSGYQWGNGLGYYQAPKDASVSFFIDRMPKGTHTFEYQVTINRSGVYQGGLATVQSAYAPQFGGHTGGYKITVE